MLYNLWR